jgi:hypothetical protein
MVGLLTEVLLRRPPARDDRLQEHRVLVFDERHEVHIVLAPDDEDALAGVTVRVRMLKDVEQFAALDVEDDVLEPDAALRPDVCLIGTHWHRLQCAQTRSEGRQTAANANQRATKKTGLKS